VNAAHQLEARRQRELLAALGAPRTDPAAAPGLRAYRANAHASAERALAAACPTLRSLIGADDFAQLAREFWHAHPPQRGDLGEWGGALPAWLEAHAALAEWPYLADCARLDLAVHRCERAADAAFDAASLALLDRSEPSQLVLHLMPGVQVLASRWPLATIHAAHAGHDEAMFEAARERVQAGEGEAMVVSREGWRALVQRTEPPSLAFMQALWVRHDLSRALEAAGEHFDFAAWLAESIRCGWLKEVVLASDQAA